MDALTFPEATGVPTVEEILGRMERPFSPDGQALVRKAYEYAERAHAGQARKSGEPYVSHTARVAWLLAGLLHDPATIAAGLLHDTIEDCGETYESIAAEFPEPIARLVDGVTKISALNFSTDIEHQAGNLRKMILAMARDVRVVLIKLCDRLHNMQTLDSLRPQRQREIAQTTMEIYAPLANRLGMTRIRALLEDLAMRYLYPSAYKRLARRMKVRERSDQQIVDITRRELGKELRNLGLSCSIEGRRKHLWSLHQKMLRQGLSFEEVHDILAIRVIADTIQECYEILGVVHSLWNPIAGRFKDYIATPKENGYRSIHTSVIGVAGEVVEIQIRTREMHEIAEEGIAAHWKYKERRADGGQAGWGSEEKRLTWLRQLVDWLQDVHDPSEFMRELKRDVYEGSVFCYTPKGDIIELPRDATALDMAFYIHSEVGNHCAGARINQRMGSIRTQLNTGDIVEIITAKSAHPTPDWLQIAHTGRARNKIRHYLKVSQRGEFLERGRRQLIESAHARISPSVDPEKVLAAAAETIAQFSVASLDDLLVELGAGSVKVPSVMAKVEQKLKPAAPPTAPRRVPRATRLSRRKKDIVLVEGMDGAVTRMARCCAPLPGDDIVGFITQGRGITVHRADCRPLANMRGRVRDFDSRLLQVQWGEGSKTLQKAAIRLICQDRKGLLSDITSAIAQLNLNIVGSNTTTNIRANRAIIKLVMLMESHDQLNSVLSRLGQIPGVMSVSRVVHAR